MLVTTEKWVREKVCLQFNQIHNVRSLILPGSRHERITHLGGALQNFIRLKNLDVSSNALVSLEGLEQLQALQRLNIYFNQISDMQEIFRLRHNRSLIELDLRLNPICTEDPRYRLFLIQLLPNLQRLNDLNVTPTERSAAKEVFTTDQLSQYTSRPTFPNNVNQIRELSTSTYHDSINPELSKMPIDVLDELLADKSQTNTSFTGARQLNRSALMDDMNTTTETLTSLLSSRSQSKQQLADQPNLESSRLGAQSSTHTGLLDSESDISTKKIKSETRHWKQLVHNAVDAIILLVDDYYRPGISLGFQFQAKAVQALFAVLVNPLQADVEKNISILQGDLKVATEKNEELQSAVHRMIASEHETQSMYEALLAECEAIVGKSADRVSPGRSPRRAAHSKVAGLVKGLTDELEKERSKLKQCLADHEASKHSEQEADQKSSDLEQRNVLLESKINRLEEELNSVKEELQTATARESQQAASLETIPQIREVLSMLQDNHRNLKVAYDSVVQKLAEEKERHQNEIKHLKWNYDELKRTANLLIS